MTKSSDVLRDSGLVGLDGMDLCVDPLGLLSAVYSKQLFLDFFHVSLEYTCSQRESRGLWWDCGRDPLLRRWCRVVAEFFTTVDFRAM